MAQSVILDPVTEQDPCGADLRWDPEFVALVDAFTAAEGQGAASVVEGEPAASSACGFGEVVDRAVALSARTKDVRVLAIYAQARWRQAGLVAFADAMEELSRVAERWSGAGDGVHPRADEDDGDLGERAAALGRLIRRVPKLAAMVGWGAQPDDSERSACAATLTGVFAAWEERLAGAFGDHLPSATEAWRGLLPLVGIDGDCDADGDSREVTQPTDADAWDLIDQALDRMEEQDHHSPALPLLRLLSTWRTAGIIDIVEGMRASGVTLEQLMESVKRQIEVPSA